MLIRQSTFCQKVTVHKDQKSFISNLKKSACASKWDALELVTLQYPTTYFVNLTKSAKTSGILLKKKYWVSVVGASFIFFQGFSLEKFGLWEMVLCYQNCSDLLWEKKMFKLLSKKYEIRGWRPRICKLFEQFIQAVKGWNNSDSDLII